jgi:hypothetical protein
MHLERHTRKIQAAALTPLGLIPLPPVTVEALILVRDNDQPELLAPYVICLCPTHQPSAN